jgi:hypothetical protein
MRILRRVSEASHGVMSANIPITAERITETWLEDNSSLPILEQIKEANGYQIGIDMGKDVVKHAVVSSCSGTSVARCVTCHVGHSFCLQTVAGSDYLIGPSEKYRDPSNTNTTTID